MNPSARFITAILTTAIVSLAGTVIAQGTAADYVRAGKLKARYSGKVLNENVSLTWLESGSGFWFRKALAGGGGEYFFVEAASKRVTSAFDHERAAGALSKHNDSPVKPHELRVISMTGGGKPQRARILVGSETVAIDLSTYRLVDGAVADSSTLSTVEVLPQPARSTPGGRETVIRFLNATDAPVRLYWNSNAKRKTYGTIDPGKNRDQPTYDGHVWLAVDERGDLLKVFRAVAQEGLAVIDNAEAIVEASPTTRHDVSPDGRYRAFYQDHNLCLESLSDGEVRRLTEDGSEADAYGGKCYWSPDSTRLVVLRTKKGGDRKVYYVESSPEDQLNPKLHSYDYLKPGDPIPIARPQLFNTRSGESIQIAGDPTPDAWSITKIAWTPDSSSFSFLYNQRGHRVAQVVSIDALSGVSRVVVDERPETFFCYSQKTFLKRLPQTDELIWMSERDGWNHLYLYDTQSGTVKNQITSGEWVVRRVLRVDDERRQVWFEAGGIHADQDPYFRHVARVNFDGTGLVPLTESNGDHSVEFSPDGRYLTATWSRIDHAPVHELRNASDGSLVCEFARAEVSGLTAEGWTAPEPFVAKGRDGVTDIYGMIIRPSNHDPEASYPVIEQIYAGPHSAFVPKSFRPYYKMQELAELGFIVVKIDGMGTSHRSKAFHDVCWKNLGDSGFPDRIAWIRAAARHDRSMDLDRVGIYGGSAGGQSSTRALLAHGDFYKAAVSDCGCHDNRVDKIWWNEQWMGWPIGPHYREQSNVTQAHRLQGDLLLVVGEMDENVDPASTMQVVKALIDADRDFDLLVIPGKGHGAAESDYGRRRRADFFVRKLMGQEPRR